MSLLILFSYSSPSANTDRAWHLMGRFPWKLLWVSPSREREHFPAWISARRYYWARVWKWDRIYTITYLLLSASFPFPLWKRLHSLGQRCLSWKKKKKSSSEICTAPSSQCILIEYSMSRCCQTTNTFLARMQSLFDCDCLADILHSEESLQCHKHDLVI